MTSVNSASTSLVSAAATSSASSSGLVKLANGEYTATSVEKDPTAASKLGLVKEKDGNYGTSAPKQIAPSTATSVSGGVQVALSILTLGGS